MEEKKKIKVALIGAVSVGKTSIIKQYIAHTFNDYSESTIGAAFITQKITKENKQINLEIWDTAGQERYRSLMPMYYRNSNVIIIVYDLTYKKSFNYAIDWLNVFIKDRIIDNAKIILVGNKLDLGKKINTDKINLYDEYEIDHILTSSKNNVNINELFDTVISYSDKINYTKRETFSIIDETPKHRGCYC